MHFAVARGHRWLHILIGKNQPADLIFFVFKFFIVLYKKNIL